MQKEEVETSDSDFSLDSDDSEDDRSISKDKKKGEDEDSSASEKDGDESSDSDEEEDGVIRAIRKANAGGEPDHPPSICIEEGACSFSFHPDKELIAVGTMSSSIKIFGYAKDKNTLLSTVNQPETTCREIVYSHDGSKLISAFRNLDFCIFDAETGNVVTEIKNATESLIWSIHSVDENIIFTGEDDGYVKLWDARQKYKAQSWKIGEDSITAMVSDEANKTLVCCCHEGFIASIKIRGGKVDVKSEIYEKAEFCCMGLFKQNTKLVVGASDGNGYVFNWNEFGYPNDIFRMEKGGVSAMLAITDKICIAGGDTLRATHLFPYKNIGVVGKHTVEGLDVCNDGHLIACLCPMDDSIEFLNVSYLEGYTLPVEAKPTSSKTNDNFKLPSSKQKNPGDFFKGLLE